MNRYPDNAYYAEAELNVAVIEFKEIEEEEWTKAAKKNTIASYNTFIKDFPDSHYTEGALRKVEFLIDEVEWSKLKKQQDAKKIREYLSQNPKTAFKTDILNTLNDLEESTWKKTVSVNTADYYKHYVINFPDGKHVRDASKIMSDILTVNNIVGARPLKIHKELIKVWNV